MPTELEDAQHSPERQMLIDAAQKGSGAKLWTYLRLSGPGWLQSAITLGGGSLAGSLYLGVLAGYSLMWLQVLAMVMGVIMLSAISYVTLSTGKRPFQAINDHINPVLGWGWAIATLVANIVWCLPQFSLGTAAVTQNLLPNMTSDTDIAIICAVMLSIAIVITWFYDSGSWGIRLYEGLLRLLVGAIVICFFGVVIKISLSDEGLPWGEIMAGFIPNLNMLSQPAATFKEALAATGDSAGFWSQMIVDMQRDVMITAVATAVGINMTFLLPYSMLRRGWDKHFRGLAVFDLSTGMAIPFIIATGCVVIASASQFHAKPAAGLLDDGSGVTAPAKIVSAYQGILQTRVSNQEGADYAQLSDDEKQKLADALPEGDKRMAAMLVKRDAFNLANSLAPLIGSDFANYVFGFGVLGMALSTITILMLISGFTFCEILGLPPEGLPHRLGCMAPAIGVLGPFVWSGKAAFWLAVPTSVFGMVLLPIAYGTFFLMMNSRSILGSDLPQGGKRIFWNVLMLIALSLSAFGAGWAIWSKSQWYGVAGAAAFLGLALIVHFIRPPKPGPIATETP